MELLRHEALGVGLDALNDLIRAAADVQDVMDAVLAAASRSLELEGALVQLTTAVPGCPTCWSIGLPDGTPPSLDASALSDVASDVVVVADAALHDDTRIDAASLGFRSLLATPLAAQGDVFGVLAFLGAHARAFAPTDVDFVRKLGASLSLALENTRLLEAEREAEQRARQQLDMTGLLLEAAARLAVLTDLPQLLDALAEVVVRSVSRSRLLVYLYDERRQQLELVAVRGRPSPPIGTVIDLERAIPYATEAVQSRRTVVGDLTALPEESRGTPGAFGASLVMATPLVYRDRTVGLIGLDDPGVEQRPFDDRERRIVEGIAAQAAVAIENARLYESQRRTAALEGALARLNEALLATLEPEQLMQSIVREVSAAAGADKCLVLQPRADEWVVAYAYNMPELPPGTTFERGELPAAERVVETGTSMLVEDVTGEFANSELARRFGFAAFMQTPLVVRGEIVGVLNLAFTTPRRFDARDADFAERLSSLLSLTLNNARLYDDQQRFREQLERSLRAVRTNEERFRGIFEQAAVGMALAHPDGRWFLLNQRMADIVGYPHREMQNRTFQEITYPDDLAEDLANLDRMRRGELPGFSLEKRYIRKDGSLVWVNLTVSAVRDREGAVEYFVVVVEDIDERKRAEFALRESKRLSEALNDIDAAINSTLDFAQIMRRVVRATAGALAADSAVIYLREGDAWVARYVYGLPRQFVGRQFALEEIRHGATREPGRGGSVIIKDAESDARANREVVRRYGVRAILDVPLTAGEEVVGDFALHYHDVDRRFTDADADFANKVAASVSLALRNARRFSDERQIADTLQHALLTVPQQLPGIRFGHLYRSAAAAADVGGDFYDLFEIAEGRIGILLGDVSGKGLEAATLTALVRNTIRAYAYDGSDAATVVGKTNDVVQRATAAGSFVTLVFALLDPTTGRLVYSSAGHPAPVLKRSDGSTLLLEAHSALLGAFHGVAYCQAEAVLEPGDILVAFTDGATEARRGGELFGEERVATAISQLPVSAVDLPQALYERIVEYAGGGLSDDLAIIAVEREF